MVRSTIFSIMLLLVSFSPNAKGVMVKGSLWLLDENEKKKEIALFFDIHNQKCFELREMEELKELLDILKLYSETADKPLYILVEQGFEIPDFETPLRSLFKILEENPLPNITIENIEQRAASNAFSDLVENFPNHNNLRFGYRASATDLVFDNAVSFQDVVNEYNLIMAFLEEAHSCVSEKVKEIHDEQMAVIRALYKDLDSEVKKYEKLKVEAVNFEQLLMRGKGPSRSYLDWLGKLVHNIFSQLMDLYVFHRVLALPTNHKIIVLAGAAHSLYVQSEIMGSLGAKSNIGYGRSVRSVGEEHTLLTKEQFAHIILYDKVEDKIQ